MKNLYILGWGAASEIYSEEGGRYGDKKGNNAVGCIIKTTSQMHVAPLIVVHC